MRAPERDHVWLARGRLRLAGRRAARARLEAGARHAARDVPPNEYVLFSLVKAAGGIPENFGAILEVFRTVHEKQDSGVNELTLQYLLRELFAAGSVDAALAV